MKKLVKTIPLLMMAAIFILPACNKYEDGPGISLRSKKSRLVGKWQLDELEVDGTDYTADINRWEIEFKKDGTFEQSIQIEGFQTSNIEGEWEFSNDKTEVEITYDDGDKTDLNITRLKNDELWFDFTENYDDGSSEKWECKFEAQ